MASTLTELSQKIGCSTATISRVLNNSAPVSKEVRQSVLKAVRESGYKPRRGSVVANRSITNAAGMQPVASIVEIVWHCPSPTEQLIIHNQDVEVSPPAVRSRQELLHESSRFSHSFFRRIIDGMLSELKVWGHRAVLQTADDLLSQNFLSEINRPDKRGILLMGPYSDAVTKFPEYCHNPLVLVDLICRSWSDVVTIDNYGGIKQIFKHIHDLGHRDIAYMDSQADNPSYIERRNAWEWNMVAAGLPIRPQWIAGGATQIIEKATAAAMAVLKQPHRPTAFICCNDNTALGVYRAAAALGMRIPQDISIVGFDDIDAASLVTPALTTVRVPLERLGQQAVRQLMTIKGDLEPSRIGCEIRVRTDMVVRQSTCAPRSE